MLFLEKQSMYNKPTTVKIQLISLFVFNRTIFVNAASKIDYMKEACTWKNK